MATHIKGNQDGSNGENLTYTIHGRGVVERKTLVSEVKAGLHPNHSIYTINEIEYVRSNPNALQNDNINKD